MPRPLEGDPFDSMPAYKAVETEAHRALASEILYSAQSLAKATTVCNNIIQEVKEPLHQDGNAAVITLREKSAILCTAATNLSRGVWGTLSIPSTAQMLGRMADELIDYLRFTSEVCSELSLELSNFEGSTLPTKSQLFTSHSTLQNKPLADAQSTVRDFHGSIEGITQSIQVVLQVLESCVKHCEKGGPGNALRERDQMSNFVSEKRSIIAATTAHLHFNFDFYFAMNPDTTPTINTEEYIRRPNDVWADAEAVLPESAKVSTVESGKSDIASTTTGESKTKTNEVGTPFLSASINTGPLESLRHGSSSLHEPQPGLVKATRITELETELAATKAELVTVKAKLAAQTNDNNPTAAQASIKFKDALGRTYNLPWSKCQTFSEIERLITHAHQHIEDLADQVRQRRYDLIVTGGGLTSDRGEIIIREFWTETIKPGMQITMSMWPSAENEANSELRPTPRKKTAVSAESGSNSKSNTVLNLNSESDLETLLREHRRIETEMLDQQALLERLRSILSRQEEMHGFKHETPEEMERVVNEKRRVLEKLERRIVQTTSSTTMSTSTANKSKLAFPIVSSKALSRDRMFTPTWGRRLYDAEDGDLHDDLLALK